MTQEEKSVKTRFVLLLAIAFSSLGLDPNNQNGEALRISVFCDSNTAAVGDEMQIRVLLENTGSEPLTVYGELLWGHRGGLTLVIQDQDGELVHPLFLVDEVVIPHKLREPTYYVRLAPGHFLGTVRTERVADLFSAAGNYIYWVEYLSPVPLKYYNQSDFWSRERGRIKSHRLRILVTGEIKKESAAASTPD